MKIIIIIIITTTITTIATLIHVHLSFQRVGTVLLSLPPPPR